MSTQDTLTIDPLAMNIVSRIAEGCRLRGEQHFEGGLLVQGSLDGSCEVQGRLVVWAGATVRGRIKVFGDLYLFGHLGDPAGMASDTVVECQGTAWIASTGSSTATLLAQRLQLYEGANLQGPFYTLRPGNALPTLNETVAKTPTA